MYTAYSTLRWSLANQVSESNVTLTKLEQCHTVTHTYANLPITSWILAQCSFLYAEVLLLAMMSSLERRRVHSKIVCSDQTKYAAALLALIKSACSWNVRIRFPHGVKLAAKTCKSGSGRFVSACEEFRLLLTHDKKAQTTSLLKCRVVNPSSYALFTVGTATVTAVIRPA